jgi:hypothetical protein
MHLYANTLITFYLFLYLHLDLICIEEEPKSVGGFRFRHRVGGVRSAFNLFYLGNRSSLICLA